MLPTPELAIAQRPDVTIAATPRRRPWPRRLNARVVIVASVLLALVLLNLTQFAQPLDRDEGAFLTIAQEILHGRVPYRDVFDHKGPGIYYLTAGMLAFCRALPILAQIEVARSLAVVANLFTAYGLYLLGTHWWRKAVGLAAACLWLLPLPLFQGDLLMTEPFAVVAVVWAVVVVSRRTDAAGIAIAGAAVALGSLFKQTAVLTLPTVLLVRLPVGAEYSVPSAIRGGVRQALPLLAGFCGVWIVVCGFFALQGALSPMLMDVGWTSIAHYPGDPPASILTVVVSAVLISPLIWMGACATLIRNWWAGRRRRLDREVSDRVRVWSIALAAALSVVPFLSHAFAHYCVQVLPWAALLTAPFGVDCLQANRSGTIDRFRHARLWRALTDVALACAAFVTLTSPAYAAVQASSGPSPLAAQEQIAAKIRSYTTPGGHLMVGAAAPEYYFLTGQEPSTAYIYLLPVNMSTGALSQACDDVTRRRFDVIVWVRDLNGPFEQQADAQMGPALAAGYRVAFVDQQHDTVIYQRTPETP